MVLIVNLGVSIEDLNINISQCTREGYWFDITVVNSILKDNKPKQIRPGSQLNTMR